MHANRPTGGVRPRQTLLCWICCTVAALTMIAGVAERGRAGLRENVLQGTTSVNLSVEDARPVAKAITTLEAKYGWIITYEDPRYAYADDIADVTETVRRDLQKYPKGAAPKVLVPKGGVLSFNYDVMGQTSIPSDPAVVVRQLLAAQAASANGGKFRLEKGEKIVHVIPTAIRDRSGRLRSQEPVLDTVVTLAAKERTAFQTLEDLCAAISKATQMRVIVGTVPLRLFLQHKDQYGTAGRKAREVLVQLFERVGNGIRLSWQLLYDPGLKMYVLNIHSV